MRVVLWAALLGIAATTFSQKVSDPITLKASSSRSLGVPAFSYGEHAQCDRRGTLYFHAAFRVNDSSILRLAVDGSTTLYTLPEDEAKNTYFVAFRASPAGELRLLTHSAAGDDLYIYLFHEDVASPGKTKISVPSGLVPRNFLVLPNDHIVVQGYFDSSASPENRGKNYIGEFDSSGRFVGRSLSETLSKDTLEQALASVPDAAVAETLDGYNYALEGARILVISPAGEIVRKMQVPSPGDGFSPVDIYGAGAFLLVKYYKVSSHAVSPMYVLIDRTTGEVSRSYTPDDELGNNLVCFSEDGFTFLRYERQRVKLLYAKP